MQRAVHRFRRSILSFLALPVVTVVAFIVLAEVVDWFDNHAGPRSAWSPLRISLSQYVGDTQAAIGVLTAIAGSLFTVTSVTFSILLLAVQQGATVLNSQIVDHYLRRRSNRAWFGFFVGVSVFVLITLVQTTHTAAPVLGVTVSTLLGASTLTALVVLIYATVDQTRPSTIIQAIANTAIRARLRQAELLRQTAPLPVDAVLEGIAVPATTSGYLVSMDVNALARSLADVPDARLYVTASIGEYVPEGAPLATLSATASAEELSAKVQHAVILSDRRDLATDPANSLDHIATIGWTAISTAHSDPAVGAIAAHALQRLLHAWSIPPERADVATTRIHYGDQLPDQTMAAVESFIVAATESRQHQSLALLFQMLSVSLPVLPATQRDGIFAMVQTATPALAEHLPSRTLQRAAGTLAETFECFGATVQAAALRSAIQHMVRSTE